MKQKEDNSDVIRYFEIRYPKSMEKLFGVMVTPSRPGMCITEIPPASLIVVPRSEEPEGDFLS